MANFERGVYEPSDEVRVFDGSEEDDDIEGSRLPLLIVLALLVLAMFGGVVWLAYTQGVARGRGETPVLTAAAAPSASAPQGGGGNVPYQGFKIYEQPAPPDDSDNAPAPAKPAATPAPVAEAPKPAPVAAAPQPAPAPVAEAPKPAPPPAPKPVAAAPKPAPAPAKPAEAPAKAAAAAPPKSVAALIQQANSAPVAASAQAPPPAAKPAAAAARHEAGNRRAALADRRHRADGGCRRSDAPTGRQARASAASGAYALQIGAFKSQAEAATAWKTYQGKHAALLSGYSDNVQQADLGEKGTWYRLRIGGFADKEVATALCDRLRADGGACMLGR